MPGMHCRIVLRHRRPGGADGAVCRGLLLPAVKYVRDTGYGRLPRRFRLSRREPVACELHSRYLRQSHQNGCVRDMSGRVILPPQLVAAVAVPSRIFLSGGYSCSNRETEPTWYSAAQICRGRVAATPRPRRRYPVETSRGDGRGTWIFRGDETRRRRGCDVDIP